LVRQNALVPDLDDTIVALSTPLGPGARAVVRLSGRAAAQIARTLIPEFEPDPFAKRQVASGSIVLPEIASPLPTDVFYFRAPAAYTGQDVVEIHTISSPPLVELLIAELLRAGARGARPGEFTMRGFLAGKLDLTRAEAVHAVIEATGADQLKRALGQLAGGLARPLDAVRDDLLNLLADVEAGLDFSDEDLSFVALPQLLARLAKSLAQVTLVAKQIQERGAAGPAFRVVLAGAPNAGKSSLFNALLGRDAALVSQVAGTTRDYLEADLVVGDITIRLIDTAGLDVPSGLIDAAAQSLGRGCLAEADLIVWCREPGSPLSPGTPGERGGGEGAEPAENATPLQGANIPLTPPSPPEYRGRGSRAQRLADDALRRTAGDLSPGVTDQKRIDICTKADLGQVDDVGLAVSVVTGFQIAELKKLLADTARAHAANPLAPSLSRCRHHVVACLDHLRRAHRIALEQEPAELLALELRLALDELGAIVGAVYTDDLLDRIFSRFCIGK
jgi:tRNA modification GTPase